VSRSHYEKLIGLPLNPGECDLIQGTAGDRQRDRGKHHGLDPNKGEAVEGALVVAATDHVRGQQICQRGGHEHLVHQDVMAARPPHAEHMPGVDDLAVLHREKDPEQRRGRALLVVLRLPDPGMCDIPGRILTIADEGGHAQ
jgi:hypothetical protein